MKYFFILFSLFLTSCRTTGGVDFLVHILDASLQSTTHSSYNNSYQYSYPNSSLSTPSLPRSDSDDVEFSFSLGGYFHRNGILEKLGDTYATLAIGLSSFNKSGIGFYFLWTADNIWKTNNEILKPSFWDEDYANYMVSFGIAFEKFISQNNKIYYQVGPAINFIEIDTNYTNTTADNNLFTDVTFSFVHKFGIDYFLSQKNNNQGAFLLGLSCFAYWAPNPLGKFLDIAADVKVIDGTSSAWLVDLKWRW